MRESTIEWIETVEAEEGDTEVAHQLPAKREVCPRCDGQGTHLNPNIGNHAYTPEEFEEAFHDEEDREQYFTRGGIYDVPCERCNREKVVDMVNTEELGRRDPDLLKRYEAHLKDEADYRAEAASEQRMLSRMAGDW
jgi:hypothetical protein